MSRTTIHELMDKRMKTWEGAKAFLEEHRGEDGLVQAEFVDAYQAQLDMVKSLGDEIQRLEAQAEIENKLSMPTSKPVLNQPMEVKKAGSPYASKEYNDAFWAMMRGYGNTMEVRNALSVGNPAKGGYTVPDEFERQLIQALNENNVFRGLAKVIRTSSGTHTIPIAADNNLASWVEEGGEITGNDMTFSSESLSAYKMARKILVSNELLYDSAFDIANYISQAFGRSFGNTEEKAFIDGTGPSSTAGVMSQPTGILTTLTAPDVITEKANKITFDSIFELYYSLKSPYRSSATFLCHDSLMFKLITIKDNQQNYIWKPSLDIGKPDTILGRPIVTCAYMPALSGIAAEDAGKKVCLFGDFSYYWIADRENRTLRRLDELHATTDQTAFICTQRVDGKLILTEAVKLMSLGAAA